MVRSVLIKPAGGKSRIQAMIRGIGSLCYLVNFFGRLRQSTLEAKTTVWPDAGEVPHAIDFGPWERNQKQRFGLQFSEHMF
jgi:hypothetical protein